ncbi:TonB-dependent receptor domain-containing protein [Methylophilus sp.]|uniref:TonB-dependent receptor domain-containing protein n=1 Tax=Methylophilus sp. TaxID=29541 RepID=UPI00403580D3
MQIIKFKQCAMYTLFAVWGGLSVQLACAEALNKQLPKQQEETFSVPINIDIPQQPLANSLHALGKATGMSISFPNDLVSGKTAPEVRGRMTRQEALRRLLLETGLAPKVEGDSVYIQKAPKVEDKNVQLDKVEVRAKRFYEIGPLPGLGLTKEEIPGNVQSISAKEIKESHSLSITDLMNRKLQSVTVNDYQGNPFQMDVQYRGFTAGPQIGTPQGLSVFFDGIRVNEPFGDVVNWDMIPMNALASVDVFPGSNPIFGLGTLGGAFSVKTKDGFNNAGTDATILAGSYGRKYLQGEAGWNNGTVALFGAGNFFLEDGWRDNSPSKVNQFFGKASYRGDKLDLNLSTLLVGNDLTGNGVVPTNFYEQDRSSVFTSPDETKNRLSQFQLSGNYFVNDTFTVTGQVYRRNSRRQQKNADVYTDYRGQALSQNFANGQEYTCLFDSTGQAAQYGLSDYVVIDVPDPNDLSSSPFLSELFNGNVDTSLLDADAFNQTLTGTPEGSAFLALAQSNLAYWANPSPLLKANIDGPDISLPETPYSNFSASAQFTGQVFEKEFAVDSTPGSFGVGFGYSILGALAHSYFYTPDGVMHLVAFKEARNGANCLATQTGAAVTKYYNPLIGPNGPVAIDGITDGGTGVVDGIPTAVINNNNINQKVDGASVQFNWNLAKHKLMVGASIDSAYAEYNNSQRLGFFDSKRNGSLGPDRALDMFAAADFDIRNNNFDGNSITKSLYVSETWSPKETVHVTGALRYNATQVSTTLAARDFGQSEVTLNRYLNDPAQFGFCQNGICPGTGYTSAIPGIYVLPAEHEKFSYYSLNPSLGATWQAREDLNLYANWAQGTRTPSVVELGCALDKTPTRFGTDPNGNIIYMPRSVALGRSCQLPSGLSGDPYLPQVRAETFDVGARGRWGESLQWNLGYYRTELKNDIYMVTYFGNQNFFDTIGKTRRQGIEMGLSGEAGKARFGLNYALTDAKFRSTFVTGGDANSSATTPIVIAGTGETTSGEITVEPGDRIPGVSLHNLNANFSYDLTPDWRVGLSAVMHSWSYLRGNENNEHRPGVARPVIIQTFNPNGFQTVYRQPSSNPGKIPGYTVFNFQTSYRFNKEWTATLLVNNLFDKEYFSAGRLGVNPFSPSINGAVGSDGYNHNSGDWLSTNFVAPGAPRGVWFSLNWHFVPD